MKKIAAPLGSFLLILAIATTTLAAFPSFTVQANGQGNCLDSSQSGWVKEDTGGTSVTINADTGEVINSVTVKAGSAQSTDGSQCTTFTQNGSNGCYSVSGIGTGSVTVTKVGSGPDCKDISHLEGLQNQPPPPPPPEYCQDPQANNIGQPLPCTYDPPPSLCLDQQANNYEQPLPCTYDDPPEFCLDPQANNFELAAPCTYDPPPSLCQDPQANNIGRALPCTYGPPTDPCIPGNGSGAATNPLCKKREPTWNCGDRFNPNATRKSGFWEWYTKHGRGYRCLGEQDEENGWMMGSRHRGWFNPQWKDADR